MKRTLSLCIALIMMLGLISAAGVSAQVTDGSYTATAQGNNADVTATVEIAEGKIADIAVEHEETAGLGDVAIERIIKEMVEKQTADIDTVSGATNSSNAIIAAVKDALAQAGAGEEDFQKAEEAPAEAVDTELTCNVVVVGAGGAGMVAALSAVENGAESVVLLEKTATTGGNTVRSTGGMNAVATPEQNQVEFAEGAGVEKTIAGAKDSYPDLADLIDTVEQQYTAYTEAPEGYFDSVELFELDTLVGGKNLNDPELVEVLAQESASGIEWLHSIGADLTSVGAFGGASVKRIHRPVNDEGKTVSVGSYLVPVFTQNVEENEAITLLFEHDVKELIVEDGAVVGVKGESSEGTFTVYADCVILATGGFGANLEMVAKYNPSLEGFVTTNAPGAMGDGIAMGEAVGAAVVDIDQIQIHPTVEQKTSALITEGLRGDGAILVNQEGLRFCDEVGTRDVVSAAEIAQTGSYAYLIVDQKMVDASSVIAGYITKGFTVQGDTYEELAEALDMDPAAFAETMNTWNACVEAGADEQFGRTSFAAALDAAPFYAIQIAPGIHHTMGGLKIDTAAEVIATDGTAIPGLYAAGEVTGGVHGANRLGGNAVADIVVFGRIAGASAAEYAMVATEEAAA